MNVNFDIDSKSQINRFSKLGVWYILALSVIATVALIGQVLIQQHLQSQVSDSRVVNLAGTQRYKSQWIVKMSMLLYTDLNHKAFPEKIKTLETILAQWQKGHIGLQEGDAELHLPGGNSAEIKKMFAEIDPYFKNVYSSAQRIIDYKSGSRSDTVQLNAVIQTLLDNEAIFLEKMDKIVYQFDQEARQKVSMLSKLEYILFAISIIVIGLEILFVFRPTTMQVSRTISQLMSSEKNAKKLSKEIGALYSSLEKSYEELSIVNQPVENPRLYAKADKGGNVTFVAEPLHTSHQLSDNQRLCDLFPGMSHPDDWMDNVIDVVSEGESWQGEIRYTPVSRKAVWVQLIITPVYNSEGEIDELAMLGSDITLRKEAEQNMNSKNRAEIEKKINQQKFRSVLILEGQEEERKRIAMDIHDGIGQMLTSLKFQIESIDLKDNDKAVQKIREIELLIKEVIREVRKVTFNLKPTVLGDFGLQAALNVFVQEIGKLTDIRLVYRTSGEIDRLPQKIENNIFRITQEAINNAIKYSNGDQITVELNQQNEELSVSVSDNGQGFDTSLVDSRNMNIESGRGFFNMYERTEYVNGQLTIDTQPGKGTTVVLKVPIRSSVLAELFFRQ
jgi:two-component system, NarL family, sensor histidine kinase DegS